MDNKLNSADLNPGILVIDLDDTLIRSDLLVEAIIRFVIQNPLNVFYVISWLFQGRIQLKTQITKRMSIDAASLPYRDSVVKLARNAQSARQPVILASASHQDYVDAVARHLGFFDMALGSNHINLKGEEKLKAIRQLFPQQGLTYVGDSRSDLAIWKECEKAILVNPSLRLIQRVREHSVQFEIISDEKSRLRTWARQLRWHQWAKNLLLLCPILAAHKASDFKLLTQALIGVAAFSLLASFVYIANDCFDLENDRRHPKKRNRPLASGDISLGFAGFMAICLLCGSLALNLLLPQPFLMVSAAYLFANFIYSGGLKRVVGADILFLALLYTLRIYAGSYATEIPVSQWLLTFSIFLFLSLACVKRYAELIRLGGTRNIGRDYQVSDQQILMSFGVSSGLMATLVVALYFSSPDVAKLYSQPQHLWLLIPLFLYWIVRIWWLTNRDEMADDPVFFVVQDKASWLILLLSAGILAWSQK